MRFALTVGGETLAWSNETDAESGFLLVGDTHLIRRAQRLILLGRRVGEGRYEAGLTTPHQAYLTLLAVLRDHGRERHLPIDFAGVDDDGLPMDFMPVPEADHLDLH